MSDGKALTTWQPSELQRHVLSVFQDHGYKCTVGAACKDAGISRQSYYDWHDKPEFSAWWEAQVNRFFRLELHRVYRAAFAAADPDGLTCDENGNQPFLGLTSDRKLLLERFDRDYCPQSKSKQEHSGAVGIDMTGMSVDELERYIAATAAEPGPDPQPASPDTPGPVGVGPA